MSDGSRWLGLLAADLEGDGGNEVIAGDQDASDAPDWSLTA